MSASEDNLVQKPKILIMTAVITGLTTIAAAFLGILPQIRPPANAAKTNKTLNINGQVLGLDAGQIVGRPDVYLVPMSNPKLMARTTAAGEFTFNDVPDQQYWIIVRDPKLGQSGAGFMDKDNPEVPLEVAIVKYKVEKVEK